MAIPGQGGVKHVIKMTLLRAISVSSRRVQRKGYLHSSHTRTVMMDKGTSASAMPTLSELSAQKLLNDLFKSKHAVDDFTSMDEHEQRLLFSHLWKDYMRLHDFEDHQNKLKIRLPTADLGVFTHSRVRFAGEDELDQGVESGYAIKTEFLKQWEYCDGADGGLISQRTYGVENGESVHWLMMDLYREDDSSGLQVCRSPPKRWRFLDCISSQLLYYRLAAVFGMPPAFGTDEYKTCWEVTLQRIGDEDSRLNLYDYKGCASGGFEGSPEASESALKLLEWLVGDNIPYTYDGVLAGCHA